MHVRRFSFLGSFELTVLKLLGAESENGAWEVTAPDCMNASCEKGNIAARHTEAYDPVSLTNWMANILIVVREVAVILN